MKTCNPILLCLLPFLSLSSANTYSDPGFSSLRRDVIVHLMDWRYVDIAYECEQYLSPMGYAAVQISPPQEHILITDENQVIVNIWNARYQPVSYDLISASGTIGELQNMIDRCSNVGVRIYAEVVLNHMTNSANSSVGSGGNSFNGKTLSYPGVPYNSTHFHFNTFSFTTNQIPTCTTSSGNIEDFNNLIQIRNCKYLRRNDLDQSNSYVQSKLLDFLNGLLAMGVGGFYVGDATLIWPDDLQTIYSKLNNLNTKYFAANTRPFIYNGVIDSDFNVVSSSEYTDVGRVTEIKYLIIMSDTFQGKNTFAAIASKLATGMLNSDEAMVQLNGPITKMMDDFEINSTRLNVSEVWSYELASATMLAIPYGIKIITSTYESNEKQHGPPSDINGNILPVIYNRDGSCGNNWLCEHRWPAISHMVQFSVTASGQPISDIKINSAGNQMAFTRGDVAFFAVNKDPSLTMVDSFTTTLPPGRYCDVTTGSMVLTTCTGRVVTVDSSGLVNVTLAGGQDNMLAIHVGSAVETFKVNTVATSSTVTTTTSPSSTTTPPLLSTTTPPLPSTTTTPSSTTTPLPSTSTSSPATTVASPSTVTTLATTIATSTTTANNIQPTVIFVYKQTNVGEVVFIIGGVMSSSKCSETCSLPITTKHYFNNDTSCYFQWSMNDSYLNFGGPEPNQGTFQSLPAKGTPLFWTTNDPTSPSYVPWNEYGQHYWMAYLMIDCSLTDDGWFNFYATYGNMKNADYDSPEYSDTTALSQQLSCASNIPDTPEPYRAYHTGKCGMRNVFQYGNGFCNISNLDPILA